MNEGRNPPDKGVKVLLSLREKMVPDFSSLVASYTSKELASPKRSTVPLLAELGESGGSASRPLRQSRV